MRTFETVTIDELIADCALLPMAMQPAYWRLPEPREAPTWHVDDDWAVRLSALDYGCAP